MKNIITALSGSTTPSSAASSGILEWISEIENLITTIGFALAGICVLALGIIVMTGGEQGLSKGKKMAVSILAGLAIMLFGGTFVTSLIS